MKNADGKVLALVSGNTGLSLAKDALDVVVPWLQPMLSATLTVAQIAVAIVTVVWIWRRAQGVKQENERKAKRK